MTVRQAIRGEPAGPAGVVARAVRELEAILGPSAVLADPLSRRLYARDASMIQGSCSVVALPSTTAEVAACVLVARRYGLPVVPRGAGSGLAGGATPLGDAVVVATTRLRTIRSVSVDDRVAWVDAGVLNLDLKQRLAPLGLTFAPDPASEACSTVGGNVATNAGGPRCLLRGVTRNHVRAVDVVLASGEVVRLGSAVADPGGYDVRALMVGSEGTLGIVTTACVALTPVATGVRVILAGFETIERAAAAVSEIVASGVSASAIELMDRPIVQVIEAFSHAGYPLDAGAVVLTELDGPAGAVAEQTTIVLGVMAQHGATGVTVAEDPEQRARLWKGRKSAQGAITRIAPDFYQYDCAVPRTRLVDAVIATRRIAERQGLTIVNVFHAGDGNLHPFIMFDRQQPGMLERVLAAAQGIAEECVRLGGVLSGEHGIGLEKRDLMGLVLNRDELELQHAVRRAFDPFGLLNPGKVLPDLGEPVMAGGRSPRDDAGSPGVGMMRPSSVADLASLIGDAACSGTTVLAVGGGTHGACVDTAQGQRVSLPDHLRGIVTYDPAELVATVDAGLTVEELDATLAEHGQEWCADIVPGSTIGGAIASGASSVRRFATGPLRDSVLGLELLDGRGRLIRVGGRTVKNSTGLDLVRLIVGSRGTLGVITRAHLRVRPRPRARSVVRATGVELQAAIAAARLAGVLAAAFADGTSVELLLEGWQDDVAADAALLANRLGGEIDASAEPFPTERPWVAWPAAALLTIRPSALEMLVARSGTRWATLLSTGHLWVGGDSVSDLIPVCEAAVETGGHVTLISRPGWPTWHAPGPASDEAGIGERVKAAFDPDGVFPRLARWVPG